MLRMLQQCLDYFKSNNSLSINDIPSGCEITPPGFTPLLFNSKTAEHLSCVYPKPQSFLTNVYAKFIHCFLCIIEQRNFTKLIQI